MNKIVLVVISYFEPGFKAGGPIKSILNLINNLSNEINFKVITSDRDLGDNKPFHNVKVKTWVRKTKYNILYIPGGMYRLFYLINYINKTSYDIIYLNSFFDPLFSILLVIAHKFKFIRRSSIIIAPRGELTPGCLKINANRKKIYIKIAKYFNIYRGIYWHATNNEEVIEIVNNLCINNSYIRVANNLVSFHDENTLCDPDKVICANKDPEKSINLKVVFLSRISKEKNLPFILETLNKIQYPITLDIYGTIEDKVLWKSCLEYMEKMVRNVTINYKGVITPNKVHSTLAKYDLFFFPTVGENFGHVIAESLSVGTPVLISDKTPWRGLKNKGWGWDISLDNINAFVNAINEIRNYPPDYLVKKREFIRTSFQKEMTDPIFFDDYRKLFRIINN